MVGRTAAVWILPGLCYLGCGDDDDDPATVADRLGVGAACDHTADCLDGQACLRFKGGYRGIAACQENLDSNCSANVTFVESTAGKACVLPS